MFAALQMRRGLIGLGPMSAVTLNLKARSTTIVVQASLVLLQGWQCTFLLLKVGITFAQGRGPYKVPGRGDMLPRAQRRRRRRRRQPQLLAPRSSFLQFWSREQRPRSRAVAQEKAFLILHLASRPSSSLLLDHGPEEMNNTEYNKLFHNCCWMKEPIYGTTAMLLGERETEDQIC